MQDGCSFAWSPYSNSPDGATVTIQGHPDDIPPPPDAPAPYPNDTDAYRRLNRTVTLRIVPTNRTAD